MGKPYVVGIDIGGQSTKLGVVDARGNIIIQTSFDTRDITTLKGYMDELEKILSRIINAPAVGGKEKVKGIGIGAPNGNYYKGTIESAPNLKWAKDKHGNPEVVYLKKNVEAALGLPVVVTNDANAAAQGEMIYGAAKGMKNFIEITLGTGVGSGIIIDGKVVYGHDGFAGSWVTPLPCAEPEGSAIAGKWDAWKPMPRQSGWPGPPGNCWRSNPKDPAF